MIRFLGNTSCLFQKPQKFERTQNMQGVRFPRWLLCSRVGGQALLVRKREGQRCSILQAMRLTLAHIAARSSAADEFERLTRRYLQRLEAYATCEAVWFRSEAALLERLDRHAARTPPVVVLLDSRGRQMSSEAFAAWIGARRDQGAQQMLFAIGPADGWSEAALRRAQLQLSLGPFTLAHALARLVLAEQLYRAFTILAGHPYHCGH